jgi:predicted nuclease of predicted toxin-antitoxin system
MKILLDENIDNRLKQVLESWDFKVRTTFDEDLSGETDLEILEHALKNEFLILTHDDDFLSLIQEQDEHPTIAYIPQRTRFREMKNRSSELDEKIPVKGEIIFL